MTESFTLLFGCSALIAGMLASLAIWSRRKTSVKLLALGLTALFLASHYAAMNDLLSRPKPLALEWSPPTPEAGNVIGSRFVEGRAIYIWMALQDDPAPRAFSLPWSEEAARQLYEATREAEQNGGSVLMRRAERSDEQIEGEKLFYADPRPAPPPKRVSALN